MSGECLHQAAGSAPTEASVADLAALRYAMLSVYYDSLSRRASGMGVPAMLLPLQVRPLPLADALARIRELQPDAVRNAVWRIVRSTPPPAALAAASSAYPAALEAALARSQPGLRLDDLDQLRTKYRAGANLLGAALVARIGGQSDVFRCLQRELQDSPSDLSHAAERLLGMRLADYLGEIEAPVVARRLFKLQHQVGLDLYQYVGEFADAVAFAEWWGGPGPNRQGMTVYPAASVIRQDPSTLITRVTVTALVCCEDPTVLARSVDPQCWAQSSEVFTSTGYVCGPFDLRPAERIPDGCGIEKGASPRLLEEQVALSWGVGDGGISAFHNVLRIERFAVKPNPAEPTAPASITVEFSLARSIDSRVLWDARAGGVLVDQGFIRVRPIVGNHWRVTTHKTLLFSNRAPNAPGGGWLDLGQMINYLAPAGLSWWLESELYGATDGA